MRESGRRIAINGTQVFLAAFIILLITSATVLAIPPWYSDAVQRTDNSANHDIILTNQKSDSVGRVNLAVNVLNYSRNGYGTSTQLGYGILELKVGVLGSVAETICYTATQGGGYQEFPWVPEQVRTSLSDSTDDGGEWVDLPFPFIFYGKAYDKIFICINGYVCFEESGISTTGKPAESIGDAKLPNAMIAIFWTDLVIPADGGISYGSVPANSILYGLPPKDAFIIMWYNLKDRSDNRNTFQLVLEQNTTRTSVDSAEHGDIYMQYGNVGSSFSSEYTPIVGIEDQLGNKEENKPVSRLPQSGDVFAFKSTWSPSDSPTKIKVTTQEVNPVTLEALSDDLAGFDWREPLSLCSNVEEDPGSPPVDAKTDLAAGIILTILGVLFGLLTFGVGAIVTGGAAIAAGLAGVAGGTIFDAIGLYVTSQTFHYPLVQYRDCKFPSDSSLAEASCTCNSQTQGFYITSYLQLCGDWLLRESLQNEALKDHAINITATFTYSHMYGSVLVSHDLSTNVVIQFLYDTEAPSISSYGNINYIVRHSDTDSVAVPWSIYDDHIDRVEISVNGTLEDTIQPPSSAGFPDGLVSYSLVNPTVAVYFVNCTVYDVFDQSSSSSIKVNVLPDTEKPSVGNPNNDVEVNAGYSMQVLWQWQDLNPKSYTIEAINPSTQQSTPVVTDHAWNGDDIYYTINPGIYVSGTKFRCTATDWYSNSESDDATYTVITLPIDSVTFLNDIPGYASDGSTFYIYNGGPTAVSAAIHIVCDAYDPNNPINVVQIGYNDGHWVNAAYGNVPFIPPGPEHFAYGGRLYLYGCNPQAAYVLKARASTDGGLTWTYSSGTITVYVLADLSGWTGATSPAGHFMHLNTISTPYGTGWHVDTTGGSEFGYEFYGYTSCNFLVGSDGKATVSGYFRQSDTLPSSLQNGRRILRVYAIDAANPSTVISSIIALQSIDGTAWVHKDVTINGLTPGSIVKIAIGRGDQWSTDWRLVAEWTALSIATSIS